MGPIAEINNNLDSLGEPSVTIAEAVDRQEASGLRIWENLTTERGIVTHDNLVLA